MRGSVVHLADLELEGALLLDHDGLPTGKSLPIQDGRFTLDGARDRTPYYLVRY